VDLKNGNYPNCRHFWERDTKSVKNCCSFECCVNDVEKQQSSVRKYEVIIAAMPGGRYGVDYSPSTTAGVHSPQQVSEMENSCLAQNYSLQRAMRHVEGCSNAIQPGSKESGGYLTDAMFELLAPASANDMTLETQLTIIWNAFSVEIALGILRAVHSHPQGQTYVVQRLQDILDELLNLRDELNLKDEGFLIRERILLRLIYLGLPQARTAALEPQVQNPPPVPDFEGDDDDKKNKRSTLELTQARVANPQLEWQTVLNSNPVQQFRALFLGRDVTTTNFGLLGL
jgi:hypothetical protein